MFEKEAKERAEKLEEKQTLGVYDNDEDLARDEGFNDGKVYGYEEGFKDGAEFGYNKANERHSPDEHIDKDKVVLGIIKFCNKIRYSLVQWNGEWWYQYGSFNAEVRLIAWYNIPELPKEIKEK